MLHFRSLPIVAAVFAVACAAAPLPPPSPDRAPPPLPSLADRRSAATSVVRAYASREALGVPRALPTQDELASAELADPPDPTIDAEKWRALSAAYRLSEAYEAHQHALWLAACRAGVGAFWDEAHAVDLELQERLTNTPIPTSFYAAIHAWNEQWLWLRGRFTARASLPSLASVGPVHRLIAAMKAWAATQPALERAIGDVSVPANAWSLRDRTTEANAFCAAADGRGPRRWPIEYGLATFRPGEPVATPPLESGTLSAIRANGSEWVVTRRDVSVRVDDVPPCHMEQCQGIDCCMSPSGCWRKVCVRKETPIVETHTFVLEFGTLPTALHVGEFLTFYVDASSKRAVLATASKSPDDLPFFDLGR